MRRRELNLNFWVVILEDGFEAAELLGSLLTGPDHVSCRRLAEFCWMETAQRVTDSPQIFESLPKGTVNDEGRTKATK